MAVYTLPTAMLPFFKQHTAFLAAHAVDPDKKRYVDTLEGARHFFDSERYGTQPFDSVPRRWDDAVRKYSIDSLQKRGTLPWQIQRSYYALVRAFERGESRSILLRAAHLSHYIADAHVPLHVTENYNGQLSGQTGIHAFFESRLPELFMERYDYLVGRAVYVSNPLDTAWKILQESFSYKDFVFDTENSLRNRFSPRLRYEFSSRNGVVIKQYSRQYSDAFHVALNGLVEKRMCQAVLRTGSFWFSAWVDAGQPNLSKLRKTKNGRITDTAAYKYKNRKILGRPDL